MEGTQFSPKAKGHMLRVKLIIANLILSSILSVGALYFFTYQFRSINFYAIWLFLVAFALLGLSTLFGAMALGKMARSLILNNDWPLEVEYGGWFSLHKACLCLAWLLLISALIVSVYVRRAPPRPFISRSTPSFQRPGQGEFTPFGGRREEARGAGERLGRQGAELPSGTSPGGMAPPGGPPPTPGQPPQPPGGTSPTPPPPHGQGNQPPSGPGKTPPAPPGK